jgi:predicted ABC-type transport system involved in lysophospholipase L1 biosynthesis ATPase subunit
MPVSESLDKALLYGTRQVHRERCHLGHRSAVSALGGETMPTRHPVATIELKDVRLATADMPGARISGLSLRAYGGRLLNILGGDTCASTRLLETMAGKVFAAEGSCRIGGIELKRLSRGHLGHFLRRAVATVLPSDSLDEKASLLESVAAPMLSQGLPEELALARAEAALGFLSGHIPIDRHPAAFGRAHLRLALFARAIASSTPVLVIAKPELNLSDAEAEVVVQALRSAAIDRGCCVVLSSADAKFANLAHETLWL